MSRSQMEKSEPILRPEELRSFDLYKNDFGLTLEDMAGKSVLDIGCGTDALFVKYCLKHNINIIGMDAREADKADREILKNHYVQGDVLNVPLEKGKFDLIISRALFQYPYRMIVESVLPLLKPGGILKIAPLFLDTNKKTREEIEELIKHQDSLNVEIFTNLVEMQETKSGKVPRYSLTVIKKG